MAADSISRQMPNEHSAGNVLLLGWFALIAGAASIGASLLSRFGVLPETEFPLGGLGLALVVAGYVACLILPALERRLSAVERRIEELEQRIARGSQSGSL